MSSIETHIRQLAADGVRIHIWATKGGEFQANVGEQGLGCGWTCHTAPDPIEALSVALRLRATGAAGREVVFDGEPEKPKVAALHEVLVDSVIREREEAQREKYDAATKLRQIPLPTVAIDATTPVQIDLEEAIAAAKPGRVLMWHSESSCLFEGEEFDPGDGLVEDVTGNPLFEAHFAAGTIPVEPCRYCNDTGHFYGDPDLGPCGCREATTTDDFEDLL